MYCPGMRRYDPLSRVSPPLLPLPPQPTGLRWPTQEWPRAELDSRVDRKALDSLLDHAFAQPEPDDLDRTHAVVIVQRGAIVAERYAHDVQTEDTFLSWSMGRDDLSGVAATAAEDDFVTAVERFVDVGSKSV